MSRVIHVGIFDDQESFLRAARACQAADLEICDAFVPYPMHELEHLMHLRRSRLPWVTLAAGLLGLGLGLWFEFYVSAQDWPLNVGGKPWDSLPAFIPVGFEMTILMGGGATVAAFFARSRLWPGRRFKRKLAGVTDDRYGLLVCHKANGRSMVDAAGFLREHGALEHWEEIP